MAPENTGIRPKGLSLQRLAPATNARVLNSTPYGTVITGPQLHSLRNRAGFRIGDDKTVNLFRQAAYLTAAKSPDSAPPSATDRADYEKLKERARARNLALSLAGRDIGEMPPIKDQARRDSCEHDFERFCRTYFPNSFYHPFSADHCRVLKLIQTVTLKGGLFAMAMPRGFGKALALDTILPTPRGWTIMGDVRVGDRLFDDRGRVCRVTFATSVQVDRPCYCITFSDGEEIVCDAEHLWTVHDRYARQNPKTLPTKDMAQRYLLPGARKLQERRYRIPMASPLRLPSVELPVPPYALGVWLGDGAAESSMVTFNGDDAEELARELAACGEPVAWRKHKTRGNCVAGVIGKTGSPKTSFQARLRRVGLLHNKHIPAVYLRASIEQRLALLQGIMDTDGHVSRKGHCEVIIKSPLFADTFCELISTLGIKYGRAQKCVVLDGKQHGPYARVTFTAHSVMPACRLGRKRARLKPLPRTMALSASRHVVTIKSVPSVPVRCIQVDSPSALYLCGQRMIPTHNTTLCETGAIWAVAYGHHVFVAVIGDEFTGAQESIESIKTELETNDLLLADFPEICFPIRCLDGIAQRASGQLCQGQRTHIEWKQNVIVLPTIAGSKASGAIIKVTGLTGRVRGMKYKRVDGRNARPSLVILDDPQNDESAYSLTQNEKRERILTNAVLYMNGPGQAITGYMPCTVIRRGDMADTILDRDKNPEWHGVRTKMVYEFPADAKAWDEYARLRRQDLDNDGRTDFATAHYRKHRKPMDAGAVLAWPESYPPDCLSALQHAMNLKIRNEAAFWAECQNEPLDDTLGENQLTQDQVMAKLNRLPQRRPPLVATRLTAFVDVQDKVLYYLVAAWSDDFTGAVIDYGAYPDQRRQYWTLRDVRGTLRRAAPGAGFEGALHAGLEALTTHLLTTDYKREDGAALRVERIMIDANWGKSTDVVYQFVRQSAHRALLLPSHGIYIGASGTPIPERKRQPGDRRGLHWTIPAKSKRGARYILYDTNWWKSFVASRLTTAMADTGCLAFWGDKPPRHRMLAEHLTAEYCVRVEAKDRAVDEWKLRPNRSENHLLDCLIGAAVAAAERGVTLPGVDPPRRKKRRRVKFSEMQRRHREARARAGR